MFLNIHFKITFTFTKELSNLAIVHYSIPNKQRYATDISIISANKQLTLMHFHHTNTQKETPKIK